MLFKVLNIIFIHNAAERTQAKLTLSHVFSGLLLTSRYKMAVIHFH